MSVDKNSPRYFVQHWRNIPQEKLDTLEEFMAWYELEYLEDSDRDEYQIKTDAAKMRRLIDEFLELNPIKAKQGEVELLDHWIKASNENCSHSRKIGDNYGESCQNCGKQLSGYGYGGWLGRNLTGKTKCIHLYVPMGEIGEDGVEICVYCEDIKAKK